LRGGPPLPSEAHPRIVFERLFGEGGTAAERQAALRSRGSLLDSFGADIARRTDSFHLNLTAFGLLAFGVGLFTVQGSGGLAAGPPPAGRRP